MSKQILLLDTLLKGGCANCQHRLPVQSCCLEHIKQDKPSIEIGDKLTFKVFCYHCDHIYTHSTRIENIVKTGSPRQLCNRSIDLDAHRYSIDIRKYQLSVYHRISYYSPI